MGNRLPPNERLKNLPELGDILKHSQQFKNCVELIDRAAYNLSMALIGFDENSTQGDNLVVKRCVFELSRHMDEAMLWITSAERAETEAFNTITPINEGAKDGEDNSR